MSRGPIDRLVVPLLGKGAMPKLDSLVLPILREHHREMVRVPTCHVHLLYLCPVPRYTARHLGIRAKVLYPLALDDAPLVEADIQIPQVFPGPTHHLKESPLLDPGAPLVVIPLDDDDSLEVLE